jgi:rhamnulokinase
MPSEKVYELTGIQVMNFNSLFQFDTLRRNKDSAFAHADKILFIPDALSYMLTGEMVTEYTIASTAHVLNAKTRQLEPELLKAVGLTGKNFARFVYPGTQVGLLSKEVQKITGLGYIPVVAVAGHDTGSAVAAVPALSEDFAYLSSGTWSLMGIETKEPVLTKEAEAINVTNEGGVAGTIRLLKNICGMWLLERCRAEWGDTSYAELIAEAQATVPFRSLINPDEPLFANPENMQEAIRQYCKDSNQPIPEVRGQIVRCIFESLAMRYREVLENLRKLTGKSLSVLHVIGGGSRNDLLNQFTANSTGVKVIAGPSEATAIGNIMMQAIATGAASDIAEMRKIINQSVPLSTFEPQHTSEWKEAYKQYINITKSYKS